MAKVYPEFPADERAQDFMDRLLSVTKGCRADMHEPDNQGLTAALHGDHLDNAMGDRPERSCGEMIVEIRRAGPRGHRVEYFNLATLVALARLGAARHIKE